MRFRVGGGDQIMRSMMLGLIVGSALASPALAQIAEDHGAGDCEAYYRFEMHVIEEQRYFLNQAAFKAIEAEGLAPGEKESRIAAARADTDKRFEVDLGAAERSKERCLKTAR